MSAQKAIPEFGKPLRDASYYATVDGIVTTLRPYSTLRTVANHLNALGLRTPSDLEWHRMHVANYIRQRGLSTNTNTND
jgi:hypothetical protein